MNVSLKKMTQEWMQLERKTIEQRKVAEDFYEKNLMNLMILHYSYVLLSLRRLHLNIVLNAVANI